jgi:glutamate-1-semialdehyde aminotransferase
LNSKRRDELIQQIREVFEQVSGLSLTLFDIATPYPELGLHSLLLTRASRMLVKRFQVPISYRQLSGELSSIAALADHLLALPSEGHESAAPPSTASLSTRAPSVPNEKFGTNETGAASNEKKALQREIAAAAPTLVPQQFRYELCVQDTSRADASAGSSSVAQINGVRALAPASTASTGALHTSPADALGPVAATQPLHQLLTQQVQLMQHQLALLSGQAPFAGEPAENSGATARVAMSGQFGTQTPNEPTRQSFDPVSTRNIEHFVARYVARTAKSKAHAAKGRAHLADPRAASGFRFVFKEAVYPLVIERSKGSKLWDVDGNEYIDISCGLGAHYLGHSPECISDAIKAQLEKGMAVGSQHALAAPVAELICEMSGMQRSALCNTGSEAVAVALRAARTVTGKQLVASFAASVPSTLFLNYGAQQALETLKKHSGDLAAIVVEPVQAEHPELQPAGFLKALRQIADEAQCALIFDEATTGFRIRRGGAQAYFGIRADLVTYDEMIGGGMPIAALAGSAHFMNALDGGSGQSGEPSLPEDSVTDFVGSFVRQPLALAAAHAALTFLARNGEELQRRVTERTTHFVSEVNSYFKQVGAPVQIDSFGSLFKIRVKESLPLGGLFFYALRARGIHVWDTGPCFISYAHSDDDIASLVSGFKAAVDEMLELRFFPHDKPLATLSIHGTASAATTDVNAPPQGPPVPGARLGRDPSGRPAWYAPDPANPGKYLIVGTLSNA